MDTEIVDQPRGFGSVTHEGVTVESNTETPEQIRAALGIEAPVEEPAAPVADVKTDDTGERNADGTFKPKKPRNDPQARIDQITAKAREAERRAEAAERRAAELEARTSQPSAPTPRAVTPPVDDVPPDPKKYTGEEYDPEYMRAMARYEAKQEIRQQEEVRQTHERQQREEYEHRTVNEAFAERYNAAVDQDPSFVSRLYPSLMNTVRYGMLSAEEKKNPPVASLILEEVFHSEHPKEMLLYACDPANAQRLATLPPTKLRRELVSFEARLDAAPVAGSAPKAVPVSHAKPPIQPVGSTPVSAAEGSPPGDDATDEEWYAWKARSKRAAGKRS